MDSITSVGRRVGLASRTDRSSARAPIGVGICDGYGGVRTALTALLQGHGPFRVLAEAASGGAALRATERLQPDVVRVDLLPPLLLKLCSRE
jgi:hypothetical protein